MTQTLTTGNSSPYSLYFHIPFCAKKCHYCHFFVLPNEVQHHESLVSNFEAEWNLRKNQLLNAHLKSVYFGGGTPALLSPSYFAKILSWLNPDSDCEITLEANPENITLESLKEFKASGINRLSIGVQTFDDEQLKILGRHHTHQTILQAIEWAHQAGFSNLSIDLMYDLPYQTLSDWEKTLKIASNLPITHLSLYNLTIEPHTLFFKKQSELKPHIPKPDASLAMYQTAQAILSEKGLMQYEISAFAKEGYASRHNTGYWTGRPFFGIGPSAYSFWDHTRFQNIPHFNRYKKSLEEGKLPVHFIDEISPTARIRELFAVEIRLLEGIYLPSFEEKYGVLEPVIHKTLEQLIEKGWLTVSNKTYCLTPQGILFYDSIAEELI